MKAAVLCIVVALICEISDGLDMMQILEELKRVEPIIREIYERKWVMFTAGLTTPSSTWENRILIFDTVILNVGDGYNSSTGVFCAPSDGMYFFGVCSNQNLGLDIVLNDVSKVQLHAHSPEVHQFGMNVGWLILQKGDHVWVKHTYGKSYWTDEVPMISFLGVLI
uniref:Heavy metal-binding protein HIP-like n=1 Tax=Crassostrea virginica TaxID=6565 RepID=A0A8B8AXS6_CRAVI|nr:heavy metal-binding protein HIP-like [Crassostrea virginica]